MLAINVHIGYSQIQEKFDSIYFQAVNDSVDRYIQAHPNRFKPEQNKFKITPLVTVGYTQEDGVGFYLGMLGSYRNGFDTLAPLSTFSTLGYISTKGAAKAIIAGNNYAINQRSRLEYRLSTFYDYRFFWGLGYDLAKDDLRKGRYTEKGVKADVAYRFLLNKHLDIAPQAGYLYYEAKDFVYPTYLEGEPLSTSAIYFGADINFDIRDDKISPTKGVTVSLNQKIYPRVFLVKTPFYQTTFVTDIYFPGWSGAVFALDLFCEANYGDSPWFLWTPIGGEARMRGYYYGRYRDRNTAIAQLELRQKIYKGHSAVVWGGAGNIFHTFEEFDIKETLPNYGVGYRFQMGALLFKLDAGFGKGGEWGILAGFNHAF